MLPLKLVRSLILGEPMNTTHTQHHEKTRTRKQIKTKTKEEEEENTNKTPLLIFTPSKEVVLNTYRLASLARDMGMNLHPTPSLSHIIFTFTHPNHAVQLPFPSYTASSLASLRSFVSISRGFFKLGFVDSQFGFKNENLLNWDCGLSLFSKVGCERIGTMDGFSKALAGLGWTVFRTWRDSEEVHLFRKVDFGRVRLRSTKGDGDRVRELRLPRLDFGNVPLRILQYLVLMTDDAFYLA